MPHNEIGNNLIQNCESKSNEHIRKYLFANDCKYAYAKDDEGNNIFLQAAKVGNLKQIKQFIKDGFKETLDFNNEGYNAYLLACIHGRMDVVQYFYQSRNSFFFTKFEV